MNDVAPEAEAVELLHPDCWRSEGERAALIAYRCDRCDTSYLPKAMTCVRCGGRSFVPQRLSPTGTLYTYSIVHGAGGVWPDTYAVGYVDFPEGVRVFGQIRETSPDALHVGATVGAEPAVLYRRKDGTAVSCYRFFITDGGSQ